MLDLVALKALDRGEAERIAKAIAEENPFITADVVADFCKKLGK
jgi:hypothetical protein